ncbi:MAG: hypothetical protein ACYC8T_17060 [Myxococcaceae bacterium]
MGAAVARFGLCGYKSRVAFDPLVLALLLGAPLLGCPEQPGICGVHEEPARREDGGGFSCIKTEDCPLPSGELVCVTPMLEERKPCVECQDTVCIRRVPEKCR